MTDTHDTNLPEKPVELEEDKKTAEVSEPATTETPAEVTLTDKPAESVQKLTKEEILNKLKAIAADVENAAKSEIDSLKQAFYKLHNSEQEAAKKLFVENGGAIEEFVPQADTYQKYGPFADTLLHKHSSEYTFPHRYYIHRPSR